VLLLVRLLLLMQRQKTLFNFVMSNSHFEGFEDILAPQIDCSVCIVKLLLRRQYTADAQ